MANKKDTQGPTSLPFKQKLKLVRQSIYASLSFRGHVPVKISADILGAEITTEGHSIKVPSALRWKLYRKGWHARLDQIEREYGVSRHVKLNSNSIILDIGANVGEFAFVGARYGAKVICVEPDPRAFACLQENTATMDCVSAHDVLIWKTNTELPFYSAPERADSSVFDEGQGPKMLKNAFTIEQFCKDQDIKKISLLKCDAEGAEPEVLAGIGDMFPRIDVIALDTGAERHGNRTNEACKKSLNRAGFHVIDESVGKRLMTFGVNKDQ